MPHSLVKTRPGFTLIELILAIFFFTALITILLTASGTLLNTRTGNLETLATKIASKQIENLRNTDFASFPGTGNFADTDLSQLPGGTATRTVSNYQSDPDIKDVQITIDWTENNAPRHLEMDTLIYKYGL